MRTIVSLICIFFIGFCVYSCKTKYIPVESVKTEWRDKLTKDSVHILDSIFIYSKNDTVFLNKYKYIYKDRLIRDTINIKDTVRIPYPVKGDVIEVNKLTGLQNFLVWCGGITLLVVLLFVLYRVLKKKLKGIIP